MSSIEIRGIYEAECNVCGQIKRNINHAEIERWVETHDCNHSTVAYSNVFDRKNNETEDPSPGLDKDYTQNVEGIDLRAKRLRHPDHKPYTGGS